MIVHDGDRPDGPPAPGLAAALGAPEASERLQAALTAGTYPDPSYARPLVERCAVEPDFYVRDMLTWALTRLPLEHALPLVLDELSSDVPQARSQALHTLSKLAVAATYAAIRPDHLHDPDDEVARAAWRAAAGLVPEEAAVDLATELALELGRGDLEVHRSLSRAFAELGEAAVPVLEVVARSTDDETTPAARVHARATLRLIDDPGATFVLD